MLHLLATRIFAWLVLLSRPFAAKDAVDPQQTPCCPVGSLSVIGGPVCAERTRDGTRGQDILDRVAEIALTFALPVVGPYLGVGAATTPRREEQDTTVG
jgi:hypothetical protein